MMIFKCPGATQWYDGITFDYQIVPDGDVPEGWFGDVFSAHAAAQPKPVAETPVTREELEQKAGELGLKFDGRTSDKKLSAMIEEALK